MNCICIKDAQGNIIQAVVGCPACGATALEAAKKQIEDHFKHVAGCTCAMCKPPKK